MSVPESNNVQSHQERHHHQPSALTVTQTGIAAVDQSNIQPVTTVEMKQMFHRMINRMSPPKLFWFRFLLYSVCLCCMPVLFILSRPSKTSRKPAEVTLLEISLHPHILCGQEVGMFNCLSICVGAGGLPAPPNPDTAPRLRETGKMRFALLSHLLWSISWSLIQALQSLQRNKLTRLDTAAAKTKVYSTVMRPKITYRLSQIFSKQTYFLIICRGKYPS